MKKILFVCASFLLLAACSRAPQFEVSGTITDAEGETLYLEHTGLTATEVEDSCLLSSDGSYCLHGAAPEFPDFYRLRIGNTYAVLAVDSVEHISLTTSLDSLSLTDGFVGSPQSVQIAQLRRSLRTQPIDEHRSYAQSVILANSRSLTAYYAVFQSKQGEPVFDMSDPKQLNYYRAVATSMSIAMPDYVRTKTLCAQVIAVMTAERQALNAMALRQYIDESEPAFLDIELPNIYGDTCRLSEHKGKVIVLDFSHSQMDQGNAYVLALRELDNKYHKRGLDIFSVSVDGTKLYWEEWVKNLPWTCVRTETTAPLLTYNVTTIPTLFLIDRTGMVQGRYTDFNQLEQDIRKFL